MKSNNNQYYALVTGASCGLGKSFAMELAKRGENVLLVSRPNEGLAYLCQRLKADCDIEAHYFEADLGNKKELNALTEWVNKKFNVKILINNAGIGGACKFESTSMKFIDELIDVNIRAMSLLTHQLLPKMRANGKCYILNVASMAAFSPIGYKSIYPASKSFIYNFSLGLAEELKDDNVSVSVVNPGPMRTNKSVTDRIESHGLLTKAGVVPTDIMARVALNKMFKGKRSIIVGRINYIMYLVLSMLPLKIKLPMLTQAMKKEVKISPIH
ncbi:MAG: short-chain dehydrogenase [Bacteroidetes bacterium]|nr:MAG: short-chain dehydrogenase [Bacteroidota bacterium]